MNLKKNDNNFYIERLILLTYYYIKSYKITNDNILLLYNKLQVKKIKSINGFKL